MKRMQLIVAVLILMVSAEKYDNANQKQKQRLKSKKSQIGAKIINNSGGAAEMTSQEMKEGEQDINESIKGKEQIEKTHHNSRRKKMKNNLGEGDEEEEEDPQATSTQE